MTFWQFFVAQTATIAGVVFLAKVVIKQVCDRDIERFKADLLKQAREHDVVFDRLHSERADAIKNLYGKLRTLRKAAARYADRQDSASEEDHESNRKLVEDAVNELIQTMLDARIFLPEKLCVKIQDGMDRVCGLAANIAGEVFSFPGKSLQEQFAITLQNKDALKEAAWNVETQLANEFRRIFRVE